VFIFTKPRRGWELANGIINVILGILLFISDTYTRSETFAFMFAVILLFNGIQGFFLTGTPLGSGWIVFSSVLAIIASLFMICIPTVFTTIAIGYIFGVYIIVAGIGIISWGGVRRSAK
jgi:uncharacterized membrane protein HdeD (DUF308 family)